MIGPRVASAKGAMAFGQKLRDMAAKGEGFYDRFPPGGVKQPVAA